jgi:hypothetical protein
MFMTSARYSNVLQNQLMTINKNAMVSYLTECLQHVNAQLNTAHHTVKQI